MIIIRRESMTSLSFSSLVVCCVFVFFRIAMRYNKTETVVIGHYWKLFPLTLAAGNISHFGAIISNSDLNISNYLYNS